MSRTHLRFLVTLVVTLLISSTALAQLRSVKVRRARFREKPSAEADILFTAERYYPVRIIQRKRGWARVEDFEGELSWVAERLLNRTPGVVVIPRHLTFRKQPSDTAKVAFKAKRSDSFKTLKREGVWVLVERADGKKGWAPRNKLWGQTEPRKKRRRRHRRRHKN